MVLQVAPHLADRLHVLEVRLPARGSSGQPYCAVLWMSWRCLKTSCSALRMLRSSKASSRAWMMALLAFRRRLFHVWRSGAFENKVMRLITADDVKQDLH